MKYGKVGNFMDAFPRREIAGRIVGGTFRGMNPGGIGESGPVKAHLMLDGDLRSLTVSSEEWTVSQIKRALNRALNGGLYRVHRDWNRYGLDLDKALDVLPYLDPRGDLREVLKNLIAKIGNENGSFYIEANGVPRITKLKVPRHIFDYFEISDFPECLYQVLQSIFEVRQDMIDVVNAQKPLAHDVRTFSWFRDEFKRICSDGFDDERLMVLMPVGQGGNQHFINSAQNIIMHANAAGKKVDMLLGLNCVDYPDEVNALRSKHTGVKNLYLNEDASNGMQVFDPLLLSEDVYEHPSAMGGPQKYVMGPPGKRMKDRNRVFAIRQQKTEWNAGKNPLQRVFVRMLNDRLHNYPPGKIPSQILLADADSWFIERPQDGRKPDVMDITTNGLGALIKEKDERGLEMIGARCHSARYVERNPGGEKIPHLDLPVDGIYRMFDASAPKYLNFMVGGGTLGDFPTMLALLAIISHRYRGSRCEDVHYTTIANRAGVRWGVSDATCVTNEVRQGSLDQPARWMRGTRGIREFYADEDPFKGLIDSQGMRAEFTGSEWEETMKTYERLVKDSKMFPDDILRGDASWNA